MMGTTMTRRRPDHRNAEVANEGVEVIERLITLNTKVQSFNVAGRSEGSKVSSHDAFQSDLGVQNTQIGRAVL